MKVIQPFCIVLLLTFVRFARAQAGYGFEIPDEEDYYQVRMDYGPTVTATFRINGSVAQPSRFLKVVLDTVLAPIDSVEISLPGVVDLYDGYANEQYAVDIFKTREVPESFYFIITTHEGKIVSRYVKTIRDFQPCFSRRLNDWNPVSLSLFGSADPNLIIFRPVAERAYAPMTGKVMGIDLLTGVLQWVSWEIPPETPENPATGWESGLTQDFGLPPLGNSAASRADMINFLNIVLSSSKTSARPFGSGSELFPKQTFLLLEGLTNTAFGYLSHYKDGKQVLIERFSEDPRHPEQH